MAVHNKAICGSVRRNRFCQILALGECAKDIFTRIVLLVGRRSQCQSSWRKGVENSAKEVLNSVRTSWLVLSHSAHCKSNNCKLQTKMVCNLCNLKMVFCYQNCSDLLWEKIVLVIENFFLKFEAEGREFAKISRSLEQFVRTVKGQNNFWCQNAFLTCSWRFLISNKLEQFKLKKNIGI